MHEHNHFYCRRRERESSSYTQQYYTHNKRGTCILATATTDSDVKSRARLKKEMTVLRMVFIRERVRR